jgi:hypothetical protein
MRRVAGAGVALASGAGVLALLTMQAPPGGLLLLLAGACLAGVLNAWPALLDWPLKNPNYYEEEVE